MHDFTLIVTPGAFASSVCSTLDILATAKAVAERRGLATPRWRVCGPQPGWVGVGHGLQLPVEPFEAEVEDNSCWVIPGIGVSDIGMLEQRLKEPWVAPLLGALNSHIANGKEVAASCSAVFLLQAAGLLEGRSVTTSWWLAPHLQKMATGCRVDPDFMVLADPPLTTAGAAFAQTDLMLHLLRRRLSPEIADWVSKALLLDRRQLQSPFVVPAMMVQGNALVSRLSAQIEASLPDLPGVKALAASVGMSERTLSRHVHKATGHSTRQLIQRVQLHKARALLESGEHSVEAVSALVGYQDATALRRLMRRLLNATPQQLRLSPR
ncbi:transcriptional regulator containing an amidase domain and an AraC-type DNA-binding HTH domain [Pseudomonas asplenii]|uniref:Transcriptional regulator containing an amidase domain and an AraC-type DNA-binding HTH domain n=1 Tax=Pseudomonas asplenii TaxID=53407 RepID=A0A0M9GFQ9_9PSED|nr:helix-turn-helix domain-containing protein [Pseudomonas fuscovaginae]KPA90067.1 transcriptional regulator containing an amidase domain and an AraC-type DNA-binding HTH domain [Pseudomonas fuscovaginae]